METPPKAVKESRLSPLSNEEATNLLASAKEAREKAYAPYSMYKVGSAILSKSGNIYEGANIENASYGATICAERVALGNMIMGGDTEIRAVVHRRRRISVWNLHSSPKRVRSGHKILPNCRTI